MTKTLLVGLFLVIFQPEQVSVFAGDRFIWDMDGPGLALIRSYRYEIEIDGVIQKEALLTVECNIGPAPIKFECSALIPFKLGVHNIRVRSVDVTIPGMSSIEGPWSPMFFYIMRTIPVAPTKIRVVKPKLN